MTLSDEDTRTEFARMRETVLYEVRPPGAAAAHATLIRRRRRVAAASSGLAVMAVAGGIALTRPQPDPAPPPSAALEVAAAASATPASSPSPAPSPSPSSTAQPASIGLYTAGGLGQSGRVFRVWLKDIGFRGPLRYSIVCSGSGTGRATLTDGQAVATATVTCGTPPVSTPIELQLSGGAQWADLSIEWDPGAKPVDTPDGWAVQVLGV